jgi:hypothetical protein
MGERIAVQLGFVICRISKALGLRWVYIGTRHTLRSGDWRWLSGLRMGRAICQGK